MSEEKLTRAAVVTGGSRGIGRAVCVALAKQGCNVVVNYCHGEAAAAETAALCKELGVEAVTVQADVSTAEGCKKLFEEAVNAFGRVDILVNNAGVTRDNLILRLSEEDFDTVLNANLKGAFLCCKEAAPRCARPSRRDAPASRRTWQTRWPSSPPNKAAISLGRCSVWTAAWQCKKELFLWKNAESSSPVLAP